VLERSPDNPYFKIQYAYQLILRDDQSGKADELLGEVESSLPAALHAKACLQYQKGSFEDARELFEQAIQQLEVPSPELLEQYGDALFQLGNTDEAVRNWEKARDMGYRSSHLSRKITDKKLYD
jgi:tetratricopeptide (TPR) repeat protein